PGKNVQLVADQGRAGDATAHGHFPFFGQLLGPCFWRGETRRPGIPVGPAPLGPVLRPDAGGAEQQHATDDHACPRTRVFHGYPRLIPAPTTARAYAWQW